MQQSRTIAFRVPEDQAVRLEALARRTGRTKAFYLRQAVDAYLDDLEERFWADAVIEEYEATGKQSRPATELWDELDA